MWRAARRKWARPSSRYPRASSAFTKPVRVLLVERDKGSWWTTFGREDSQSESAEIAACMHDEPLGLPGCPQAILQLAEECHAPGMANGMPSLPRIPFSGLYHCDPWSAPLCDDRRRISRSRRIRRGEPKPFPGCPSERGGTSAQTDSGTRQVAADGESPTARHAGERPLPKANSFDYLATSDWQGCSPTRTSSTKASTTKWRGRREASASFAGLQPDILGERYVLDRVSAKGIAG